MSTTGTQMDVRTLKVNGATLYYEVRGSGPVLLLITGGPTDAGMFTDLAGRLADRYTVVSYDQRGHSRSPLDGEPQDLPPSVHADDAAYESLVALAGAVRCFRHRETMEGQDEESRLFLIHDAGRSTVLSGRGS